MTAGNTKYSLLILSVILALALITGCAASPQNSAAKPAATDVTTDAVPEVPSSETPDHTASPEVSAAEIDFTDLDACVSEAIISYNKGHYSNGEFQTESHVTLKTVEDGDMATVYMMAFYAEFDFADGETTLVSGSHVPVAITFSKGADGVYSMTEYWEASDGAGYAASIKEKFPSDVADKALDTQVYVKAQSDECYDKAKAYFENQ